MTDLRRYVDDHLATVTAFRDGSLEAVGRLADMAIDALASGGKLITFGNGGSAADAQHFAAELLGHFKADRRPLAAVALTTDASTLTAIGNDYSFEDVFARQVTGVAQPVDVVVGITTSGRSENVIRGLRAARQRGARTVGLTRAGGMDPRDVDLVVGVPSESTARIQEVHLLVIHLVCERIDRWASDEEGGGS